MINFLKSLPKHLKTGFVSLFRHFAMTLTAASAVMVTLILLSIFLLVAGNVNLFTSNIEEGLRVHVILEKAIESEDDVDRVREKIAAVEGVDKIEYSDKKEELELFIKEKGSEFEMYRGDKNPLPNAFFVSVKDSGELESVSKSLENVEGVSVTAYGGNSVTSLIDLLDSIRSGGLIFVVMLTLLALFLISNSIKMTIYSRHSEIAIMRNVGATNTYIKVPFMFEGMFIGFLGAIIPCLLTIFGYQYLYGAVNGQLVTNMFALENTFPFTLYICGGLIAFGVLVGIIGSFLSTTRYLRWKR